MSDPRGRCAFAPDKAQSELTAFGEVDQPGAELGRYLEYYDLDYRAALPGTSHEIGYIDAGEHRLVVQRFTPSEPIATAVVCHGYYDHVGLYGHLIRFLLERNLTVVTFDQPGHGLSSGPRADIASFDSYVRALEACLTAVGPVNGPAHLLGQSMGGAVALEYLAQHRDARFSEVVLFAPLVRPALWSLNRLVFALAKRLVAERPRTFTNNADNPEFLEFLRTEPLQAHVLPVRWVQAMVEWMQRFEGYGALETELGPLSVKIIQGDSDRTVDWRYNLKCLRKMCETQELHLEAGRHHLVNESLTLREQMWGWLDRHCHWEEDLWERS